MTDAPTPRDDDNELTYYEAHARVVAFHEFMKSQGHMATRWNNAIDAYLSALTAAGYVVEQDWRDIATAPMDGTEVLVRAAMPDRLQWADPDKQLRPVVRVAAWHPDAGWCVDELREAILWRPLPAAPTTKEDAP